jgi:CHAT domain-containing protein
LTARAEKRVVEQAAVLTAQASEKPGEHGQLGLAQELYQQGILYMHHGNWNMAIQPLLESSFRWRKIAESDPAYKPQLAEVQRALGDCFNQLGRYKEAREQLSIAVVIHRELAGMGRRYYFEYSAALNDLARSYSELGEHEKALDAAQQALTLSRSIQSDKPEILALTAVSLIALTNIHSAKGDRAEAARYARESVEVNRQLVNAQPHPFFLGNLAGSLHNLGAQLSTLGQLEEAVEHAREAVAIFRSTVQLEPSYLGKFVQSLESLALHLISLRRQSEALQPLQESVNNLVIYLQGQLPLLPEGQRQKMVAVFADRWQIPFSLADTGQSGANLALFTRLNRHGLLLDIQRSQALLARNGPWQPLRDQIRSLKAQLGSPTLPEPQRLQLQGQLERSEQELYRQLPQLKPQLVEPLQVARRLPADGVLIEFQRYRSLNLNNARFEDERYLALVLTPNGSITSVALGDAKEIDNTIQTALRLVGRDPQKGDPQTTVSAPQALQALSNVRRRLLDPLAPHIASARQLFLSPDGEINNVPLAALPINDGDPLASPTLGEHKTLHLLTTGRDLLPPRQLTTATSQAPLVIANPDYDAYLPTAPAAAPTSTPQTRSGDSLSERWYSLANTKDEGDDVRKLLAGTLLEGPQATTTRLQQAQAPRILHIATHGFFLPDQPRDLNTNDPFHSLTRLELPLLTQEDPLLRSGIVLAGANHPTANPSDDGRLTALEATALALEGTELVTLSACSTGLGSNATGEGVYGLQRALRVAGARSTLLSLWKVDDAATRVFMKNYYSLLQKGVGRGEALRQVQRQFRNLPVLNHPHYWAAWQLSGDSGGLLNAKQSAN